MKKLGIRLSALLLVLILTASLFSAGAAGTSYTVSGPYGESVFYENLKALSLTGDYRTDLVNVALTQVGYHEGANSRDRHGNNLYSDGNYTEYGYFAQLDGYAWCAMFISWCARQARIPGSLIQNSNVARAYSFGLPFYTPDTYSPRTGDIVFFAEKGHVWDHVGIVLGIREGWLYTIEGNARNAVRIKRYELDDDYIRGYGVYDQSDPVEDLVQRKTLYLLYYDLNGGEGKRTDQVAMEGNIISLYPNEPDEPNPDSDEDPENSHWCWKEGCDFEGWYMRRISDGKWLTEAGGWQDNRSIRESGYARRVFGDGEGFTMDETWSEEDFGGFTLYAVWRNQETGEREEESAYIVRCDSQGWGNPFRDLSEDSVYYAPVKRLIQRGLVNGVSDNRFGSGSTLTLAQFLALLHRSAGSPESPNIYLPYADVKPEAWYYSSVSWAWQTGCIPEKDYLHPNTPLARGEFLNWLYTCAVNSGKSDPVPEWDEDLVQFRALLANRQVNSGSASPEALAWAQRTGLLRDWGVSLYDLLVRNRITRLEAIGLLAFYIDRNVK